LIGKKYQENYDKGLFQSEKKFLKRWLKAGKIKAYNPCPYKKDRELLLKNVFVNQSALTNFTLL